MAQRIVRFCNRKIRPEKGISDWDAYRKHCLEDLKDAGYEYREYFDSILVPDEREAILPQSAKLLGF